ncbi:AraC family transcriptional regulator [Ekhidna sp.]
MLNRPRDIQFDRNKRPDIDFDIYPLEQILNKKDLDHNHMNTHRVNFYVLILVSEGVGKHTIDFNEYLYESGSILTIRKDQIHHFHQSEAKGFMLLFTEEYMLSYLEQKSAQKIPTLFNELLFPQHSKMTEGELKETWQLINQINQEFNRTPDDHTSGIIRNYLQVLISKIYRSRTPSADQKMEDKYTSLFMTLQYLVEQNCLANRSVSFYSEKLNVTARTLNNITHKIVSKSAKKFIDDILILQIKRLLINTNLSVKEIAYSAGFDEPTNLFKYFKRFTNQTPESFRTDHA